MLCCATLQGVSRLLAISTRADKAVCVAVLCRIALQGVSRLLATQIRVQTRLSVMLCCVTLQGVSRLMRSVFGLTLTPLPLTHADTSFETDTTVLLRYELTSVTPHTNTRIATRATDSTRHGGGGVNGASLVVSTTTHTAEQSINNTDRGNEGADGACLGTLYIHLHTKRSEFPFATRLRDAPEPVALLRLPVPAQETSGGAATSSSSSSSIAGRPTRVTHPTSSGSSSGSSSSSSSTAGRHTPVPNAATATSKAAGVGAGFGTPEPGATNSGDNSSDWREQLVTDPLYLSVLMHEVGHAVQWLVCGSVARPHTHSGAQTSEAACSVPAVLASTGTQAGLQAGTGAQETVAPGVPSKDVRTLQTGPGTGTQAGYHAGTGPRKTAGPQTAGPASSASLPLEWMEVCAAVFERWGRAPASLQAMSCHTRLGVPLPPHDAARAAALARAAVLPAGHVDVWHMVHAALAEQLLYYTHAHPHTNTTDPQKTDNTQPNTVSGQRQDSHTSTDSTPVPHAADHTPMTLSQAHTAAAAILNGATTWQDVVTGRWQGCGSRRGQGIDRGGEETSGGREGMKASVWAPELSQLIQAVDHHAVIGGMYSASLHACS